MSRTHTETSRFLSYVLRHAPESIGLEIDREGWVEVDALVRAACAAGRPLDRALLEAVIRDNDKQRFALSDDGLRVRAVQGHSTGRVQLEYEALTPPDVLYHGTASRFMRSIDAQGLRPGRRHHVHLTEDPATARTVGARYGLPVLLRVDARAMHADGMVFHRADNGVWLTGCVPARYYSRESDTRSV